jgi:hypothetical protein
VSSIVLTSLYKAEIVLINSNLDLFMILLLITVKVTPLKPIKRSVYIYWGKTCERDKAGYR